MSTLPEYLEVPSRFISSGAMCDGVPTWADIVMFGQGSVSPSLLPLPREPKFFFVRFARFDARPKSDIFATRPLLSLPRHHLQRQDPVRRPTRLRL